MKIAEELNSKFETHSQPSDNPKIAGWKNGRPQLRNKDGELVDYTDIKAGEAVNEEWNRR